MALTQANIDTIIEKAELILSEAKDLDTAYKNKAALVATSSGTITISDGSTITVDGTDFDNLINSKETDAQTTIDGLKTSIDANCDLVIAELIK